MIQTVSKIYGLVGFRVLESLGLVSVPSHTNFVLVKFSNSEEASRIEQYLRSVNILVRPMLAYGLPDYLRITVGSESSMQRVFYEIETIRNQD